MTRLVVAWTGLAGVLCAGPRWAGAADPTPQTAHAYALEVTPARTIRAILSCEVNAPRLVASEWIVCVARPPELPGQTRVTARMTPRARLGQEESPRAQPLLLAKVPVRSKAHELRLEIEVEYEATLLARRLVPRSPDERYPPVVSLGRKERELALAATGLFDFDSKEARRWISRSNLARQEGEGDIELARRVFLQITRNFGYEYRLEMERRASFVCEHGRSDCGGLVALFVAVLRSAGIPARLLAGRWARSAAAADRLGQVENYQQQHVKAEFYSPQVGWIPADLSSAVLYDTTPDGLAYFGNDPGDLFVMHLDSDMILDTVHFGKQTVPWLQDVTYWVTGKGSLEGVSVQRGWKVEER